MGAGTSKIPDLKNLSKDQLVELQKNISRLIEDAESKEDKPEKSTEMAKTDKYNYPEQEKLEKPATGGKKRRKNTKKHRKKHMKKTGKK